MRTSRISRDTARVLGASSTRRSLRQPALTNAANARAGVSAIRAGAVDDTMNASDSELSSVSPDAGSEGEAQPVPQKRKRGQSNPAVMKHKKRIKTNNGNIKLEPPAKWEEMYALTREMRNEKVAPVDTMGCERLADRERTPRDQRFQTLIALMLSSQTKDTVLAPVMRNMQDKMAGGFNLESVLALEPPALNAFINKVGFHNLKTKYIKQTAEILRDKWNSDIPDTIEGLVSLPGVGPKMGYLTLSAAWGRHEGIGVDVHVHRIVNLWKWHKTQTPEQTRAALESWLPKEKWHDINNLLVGFGQTICLPVGRKCGECKLADRGLCPSAVVAKRTKIKKEEAVVKIEVPEGEAVVQEKVAVVADFAELKAEHVEGAVPDMEDIGKAPRKRSRRKQ